jgi:hypothetical protein
MKRFVIALCILMTSGCASQNTTDLAGYTLLDESLYLSPLPQLDSTDEYAVLVVRRDSGFRGSALRAALTLNGKRIVNLRPGEYVELKVNPGRYVLGLSSNGFAFIPVETQAVADVEINSRNYYRVLGIWGGGMQIRPLEE